jgi:hypothetical protein
MAAPHLTRAHDVADVKAELADALAVVDELAPPDDLRVAVFQTAASALLLRVADPRPSPIAESLLEGLRPRE